MGSILALYAYDTTVTSNNTIGALGIGCDASGNIYTTAPHPSSSANDDNIATTYWVKNRLKESIAPSTDNTYDLGSSSYNYQRVYTKEVRHGLNSGSLVCSGGDGTSNGANLVLYGTNRSDGFQGRFELVAKGSSDYKLAGLPSGNLTWNGKNVAMQEDTVPRNGGAVMTDYFLGRSINTSTFMIGGGTSAQDGATIEVFSSNSTSYFAGAISFSSRISGGTNASIFFEGANLFRPSTNGTITLGNGSYRWGQIYSTNATISTSDSRLKNSINDIDDKLLDAWETIQPKQYKFNDAIETKGEQARFHTGYLAQDIQKACTDNDIDISKYGLFCYDSWEEEPEITEDVEVEKDGVKTTEKRIVQSKREKGDMYALRYEEALVVECAFLRREVSKLKQQNENFEQRLKMLKQSVK